MAQTVKDPPAIQETQVQSPGQEDNPGKGMATHSLGNSLENYLENSMDRGAWWSTVHGVAMSQTRLSD